MNMRTLTVYRFAIAVLFLALSMLVAAESGDVNMPVSQAPAARPKVEELYQIAEAIEKIKQEYVDPVDDATLIAACRESMLRVVSDRSNSLGSTGVELSTSKSVHEIFAELFNSITQQDPQATTARQLRDECLQGMLKALDSRSAFLNEEDFKALRSTGAAGVGVEIDIVASRPRVVTPIEGGPAHRAGLKSGDVIVMIDRAPTDGLSLEDVGKRFRGIPGSSIALTVVREGSRAPLEFVLTREVVRTENLTWRLVAPGYTYIRLRQFPESAVGDLARAIESSYRESQGDLKGLILDMRSNPGGLLPACVGVAAAFLPANALILETKGRTKNSSMRLSANPNNYTRSGAPDLLRGLPASIKAVPMAVLVNHGSAACSEIVAAALQDHKRGKILGARTFGLGTIATIWPLRGNTGLKLTSARLFRPSGNTIEGVGVAPDVILEETKGTLAPFGSEEDLQLVQTVKILGSQSKPRTIPGS
jgi:carboxyl-terminal processing protease